MPAKIPKRVKDDSFLDYQDEFTCALIGTLNTTLAKRVTRIAWNVNTGDIKNSTMDDNLYQHSSFNNNRQFIQLEKSFNQQLEQNGEVFKNSNNFLLKEKMRISADSILNYCPDKVSLQLTNEGSIFYTFFKDKYTIYVQHFLIDHHDGSDEAIISIFNGDENLLNFGGSLADTLSMANHYLTPKSFAVLELS